MNSAPVNIRGRLTVSPRLLELLQKGGLLFALIVMVVSTELLRPQFLHLSNIQAILLRIAVIGIVAIPGAMLLMAGYVDLSVGSVAMLSSVLFGQVYAHSHSIALSTAACLGAGLLAGAFNAELIARRGLSPVIVTLGGLAGYKGAAELLSHGQSVFGFGDAFDRLGSGSLFEIPIPGVIFIGLFALTGLYWYQSPLGRRVISIGTDKPAARAVGIATTGLPALLYVASGLSAALGGLVVTAQLDSASLSIGNGMELQVLTAVLLGGVSFEGGRGSFSGVMTGLLFLGVLYNGLVVLDVSPFWSDAFVGIALALAAGLDVTYRKLTMKPAPEDDPGDVREAPEEPAAQVTWTTR